MSGNHLVCIDRIWMAISTDADGHEGICSVLINGAWMPLMAADPERLDFVREQAALLARHSQMLIRIVRLDTRTEIEQFDGRN